jgi:uncharacterized protein YndB with AHSA1/START domain
MTNPRATTRTDGRDLILTCVIDASPAKVFRAWTDPTLITQWFTLADWRTVSAELDPRAGGSSLLTMQGPDGAEMLNRDVYLEVVPDRKLVFTDAYTSAWEPAERPFLTWMVALEGTVGGTKLTLTARHWSVADCMQHEKMGFHTNWLRAIEQLAALVERG